MRVNVITLTSDGEGGLKVATPTAEQLADMSLSNIAAIIDKDWRTNAKNGIYFGAKPYLNAMMALDSIEDAYGLDDGASIVTYFLGNATSYRGETARAIKSELKARLKGATG